MTYDELEALVLDVNGGAALQQGLAPLDEKARAKLSAPAQKLYRQLYFSKAAQGASDRLTALLAQRNGNSWSFWNATETRHATLVLFALCPISVVKKREIVLWHELMPLFDLIIRDRRPEWLDDWIAHDLDKENSTYLDFRVLRGWIRDGICKKPEVDGYYRMFAWHLMRTGFYQKGETVPPITVQLLADPDLLSDVEGLFRVESMAFNTNSWLHKGAAPDYETWTEALVKLSAEGHLDRAKLLQSALEGLTLDLKQNQLSGFHGFYKKMSPNEAELLRHQPGYVDLLCHPVGHVVKFAIEMLGEIEKKGALDLDPALRELPAVFSSDGKGNALGALKLLKRIIKRHKKRAPEALKVVAEALRHVHSDVQSQALEILIENSAGITPEDLAVLRDMESFVSASNRARFTQLVPAIDQEQGSSIPARSTAGTLSPEETSLDYHPLASDRIEGSILRQEDAIVPILTIEALIEAVLHAVESVDSPDEVERIIDAISRLATSRPTDFDARVAPLLHRLKTGRGTNSIVLGTVGLGGALLDLIYTWLTGQFYQTPGEESEYYTLEDGFVPVRAHLRTIIARIHRGIAEDLLSMPTHKGGWIDPLIWVERLKQARGPQVADGMDFRLSLLRLSPDHRAEALEQAATLPEPLHSIANFALGGNARPTRSDRPQHAAWITAARCHDPFRDWTTELAALNLDDTLPDGIRPARYVWRSTHKPHQYDKMRWKIPEFQISVICDGAEGAASPERSSGFLGRIGQALGIQTATEWSNLPTAALNHRMDTKRYWAGELNSPWVAQWLSYVWPQNTAAASMRGVTRLMLRTDDNSSSWSPSHGYFQQLFQPRRPWREPGHLLLCLGLVGKDADARGLAIDAMIEGIDARLFDPKLFASTIERLAEGEWIKLNRLGDALMPVIQVSALHAAVVSEALQFWLPALDFQQSNAFRLLEVLDEAQALTGKPLSEGSRKVLSQIAGSGKAAKLAKQLAQ